MAELVEQRRGVVEADEGRHALRVLGEIIIVRREDIACPPERLLAAIGGHPRARALSVAREIIEIKEHDIRRSEEHTSELQSLMRISYAVFCLKKKTQIHIKPQPLHTIHTHSS